MPRATSNRTNNNPASRTYTFRVYRSTNDNVSSGNTLLSTKTFSWNFGAMSTVRVNMGTGTMPGNTVPGNDWIGVILDSGTDTNRGNISKCSASDTGFRCGAFVAIRSEPQDQTVCESGPVSCWPSRVRTAAATLWWPEEVRSSSHDIGKMNGRGGRSEFGHRTENHASNSVGGERLSTAPCATTRRPD